MDKFTQSNTNRRKRKRWTFLCFLVLLLAGHAKGQSPALDQPVTLSLTNTSLAVVIAELDQQNPLAFSYDRGSLSAVKVHKVSWKGVPLKAALAELTQITGMSYVVNGNTVAVKSGQPVPPGSIRGRVVDFETSAPLPGATVQIQGTASGAVTDNKGYYQLNNVPVGAYTLVITFIGYQRGVIDNVNVSGNRQSAYDVKMQAGGSLKEVVVDAGPRKVRAVTHSTDQQLLQEIRSATGVVSGISNELIARTADRNAAEIVKRIAGVTVVDDRFIVVRGMNERYNLTYLNGNIAPSTELYSKAFAYDLLPSSVIDKILVYKSPVADLVADYAGAAVKIYTKNAMPVKHFDIGIQLAHRVGSTMKEINSYNGGKYDVLGFDDGTRKLPGFAPGIFESNKQAPHLSPEEKIKGFSPVLDLGTRKSLPDMQVFGNYYNSWRIGKARLYDLTSLTFTRETIAYDIYRQRGNTHAFGIALDDGTQSYADNNKITYSSPSSEVAKVNLLQNLTLQLNDRHRLVWKNFFVNDGRRISNINTIVSNKAVESIGEWQQREVLLSFEQRMMYSGNISGAHTLGEKKQHELEWNIGYTHDLQSIPDLRISRLRRAVGLFDTTWSAIPSNFQGMISRQYIKNLEQVYNGSADYTFHIHQDFYLKTGAYLLFKTRQVGRRFFRINRAGLGAGETDPPSDDVRWYDGYGVNDPKLLHFKGSDLSKVWSPAYFKNDNTGLDAYDATSPVDSYTASEQYNAFYVMGDWKTAGEKITVNAGARLEYDRQQLAGADSLSFAGSGTIYPINIDHKKTVLLPSVNLSYRPSDAFVIRGSYGRTVNRPDFRELTPYNDFDFQRGEIMKGNRDVITATIDNYDLRGEFYPKRNKNEMFNVGIFYKRLQNPIERMRRDMTSAAFADNWNYTRISFANSVSAEIYGVEAEIRKSLSFLPGSLFRHLSIVVNGSLLKSTTVTHKLNFGFPVDSITKKGEPLQGQSPYTVNAGLFYENPAWGTKIGLVYNVNGARIYAKSERTVNDTTYEDKAIRPHLLQLPMHLLDLSITQRLIKSLQVKFSIQNLLDQSYRIVEDQNYNQRYDAEKPKLGSGDRIYYTGDNIYTRYKPGMYWLLQLTYAL
ncbi:MAG TPA: TonB-dependent receptor [Chitinophaga sp.]|uniref:TonB-dependent receptor n=1 Tax=Chitinophaga sp. TaxID=1869181 RepID=UPI002C68BC95|nr:TonB-dependent receptor [Chitinophaga sp.]HVI45009.1 TonB-dependent receptor [Chitinophaga sp.]